MAIHYGLYEANGQYYGNNKLNETCANKCNNLTALRAYTTDSSMHQPVSSHTLITTVVHCASRPDPSLQTRLRDDQKLSQLLLAHDDIEEKEDEAGEEGTQEECK